MPLARISVPSSLPQHKISALAAAVHTGLVATCNVPEKDRFQLISVFPPGTMIIDPTFPDVRRTPRRALSRSCSWRDGRSNKDAACLR